MSPNIKLIDGGFSSQLSKYVGNMDGDPLWTARFISTNPNAIIQTHLDFLNAGADMIETCTYQASVEGFKKHLNLSEEEALNLIKSAGDLALKAKTQYQKSHRNSTIEIVGSIGPFGALLHDGSEYTGNYTDKVTSEDIKNFQRPKIIELMKSGITMFAFETIPSKKEALSVIDLLKEFPDITAWLSFSCKDNESIACGDNFKETAIQCYELNRYQIVAVGVNCLNPLYVNDLFKGINEGRRGKEIIPLIAYPNSGEKYDAESGWNEQPAIKPLHTFMEDWVKLGARYIGGCCRTKSEDIELMRKTLDNMHY